MDKLPEMLGLVNEWLRFAEAKNGVLIAASGAALWGLVRLVTNIDISPVALAYLLQLSVFIIVALVSGLVSFLPITNYVLLIPLGEPPTKTNILFFGHLAKLRPKTLLQELRESTDTSERTVQRIHEMYAEQIIANSRIALGKYRLFSIGVWCVMFGLLTPALGTILWLLIRRGRRIDGV